jgi:hypothetical protein
MKTMKTMKTMKMILFLLVISVSCSAGKYSSPQAARLVFYAHVQSLCVNRDLYEMKKYVFGLDPNTRIQAGLDPVSYKELVTKEDEMTKTLCTAIEAYFGTIEWDVSVCDGIHMLKYLEWYDFIYNHSIKNLDYIDFMDAAKLQQLTDRYTVSRLLQDNPVFMEVYKRRHEYTGK